MDGRGLSVRVRAFAPGFRPAPCIPPHSPHARLVRRPQLRHLGLDALDVGADLVDHLDVHGRDAADGAPVLAALDAAADARRVARTAAAAVRACGVETRESSVFAPVGGVF